MHHSSYIQTILNAFVSMNIETLSKHLKGEYSYEDTDKEIFLNEIERLFKRHKNAGDTKLVIYEGKCTDKSCPNCGNKGYRFVGNHSGNYLDLIFDTEKDDIKNIFSCNKFKTDIRVKKLKYKYKIEIHEDDKVTFNKTPEYLIKVKTAEAAWSEIITSPPKVVDFNELCYWVDKHAMGYELFEDKEPFDNPMKWSPFLLIYPELQGFKEYLLQNIKEIQEANSLIDNIQSEEQLLKWLMRYEEIGTDAPHGLKYSFREKDDYFWWNYYNPVYFKDEVFSQALGFFKYYQKHYEKIFEKYTTYTDEEASILYNYCDSKEETKNLYSLRFHMQNRKNMEAMGVHIPLYIDKNNGES